MRTGVWYSSIWHAHNTIREVNPCPHPAEHGEGHPTANNATTPTRKTQEDNNNDTNR